MKNLRRILVATLVLAAFTATVWAQNAHKSAIVGSAHDLTTYTWTASGGTTASSIATNLCFFCHITHKTATMGSTGTSASSPGYMAWNHTLSSQASYGVYSSDTFNALLSASGATITDLGSSNNTSTPTVSNLCLSCHDGTVALANFYNPSLGLPSLNSDWYNGHGTLPGSTSMYSGMQVTDLTKSHPVNFTYTAALATAAGGTILSPSSLTSVDGAGAVPLYGGTGLMECTTCHDPHNGTFLKVTNGTTTTTVFPFPRAFLASQTGSGGFCAYCHT